MLQRKMRANLVLIADPHCDLPCYQAILTGHSEFKRILDGPRHPYDLEHFEDARHAFRWLRWNQFGSAVLVLTDFAAPGASVIPLMRQIRWAFPRVAMVLRTTSRPLAVEAFDAGAFAVIREPAADALFRATVRSAWLNVPLRDPLPLWEQC